MANQYIKTGVKNVGTVFLMTDAQVSDERFLVLVNDLLASGMHLIDFISGLLFHINVHILMSAAVP